jgi:hypothetical protein
LSAVLRGLARRRALPRTPGCELLP